MLINPDPNIVHTRGCGPLMKYWYRRGFWENIFMGLFGIFAGVFMLFVFQRNRREYTQLRDDADDRKRIIKTQSLASLRSANANAAKQSAKPAPSRYAYTEMKSTPSNVVTAVDDSDDDSSSILYQARQMLERNA